MEPELIEQYSQQIHKAKNIAIVLPEEVTVDQFCSGLALQNVLSGADKSAVLVSSSGRLPELKFFGNLPQVYSSINSTNELVIKVSNQRIEPKALRYEKADDGINIFIKPGDTAQGNFTSEDVSILPAAQSFDLLIIIGAASFEELGKSYSDNPQLFYNTTKIAVSTRADHEYFAAVNIVDTQAAAVSEIVFQLLLSRPEDLSSDLVLTGLLAGITAQTQSFRDSRTTPQTLSIAAKLVERGARQQDIIQYLFKTKSFALLQLWGRAMARIQSFPEINLLYTVITEQDFAKTNTTPELLEEVSKELVTMSNSSGLVAIAAQTKQGLKLLLAGLPHIRLRGLAVKLTNQTLNRPQILIGNYRYITIDLGDMHPGQIESFLKQNLPKHA